ncbi:serine hydrolase domain-containing protein [Stenotrophomonas sp. P5_B8]
MRLLKSLVVALLLFSITAHAGTPLVTGEAEHALRAWLAAFNDGDRDALAAFREQYKMRADAKGDLEFRAETGELRVLEVVASTPGKVQMLLLPSANDRVMLVTATLDPDKRSAAFAFEGAQTPAKYQPRRMAMADVLDAAKTRLDALQATGDLGGVFLVARQGDVQMAWHGGLADREQGLAVARATRFRLASLNKMFTAVSILQLQEAGKLSLDDTLAKHLPRYPNPSVAGSVTLRQLLDHTSGLGDIFGDKATSNADSLRTLQDYWAVFGEEPVAFTPGSRDQYSNYAFILLGSVIEAVSEQSYYDYVDEHIYRVAGMSATGSEPESMPVVGRAKPYTKVDGRWTVETASLPWRATSAGGGYSTVDDMLKFGEALRAGKLLSPTSLAAATSPQNHKAWYGYGFMVRGEGRDRLYGHEGGAPGANAVFYAMPAQGYVLVGLSNVDPEAMGNVVNFVANRLPL